MMTLKQKLGMELIKPAPIYSYDTIESHLDTGKFLTAYATDRYRDLKSRYGDRFFGVRVAFPPWRDLKDYNFAGTEFYASLVSKLPKDCEISISGPLNQSFLDYLARIGAREAYQIFLAMPWSNVNTKPDLRVSIPKVLGEVFTHVYGNEYDIFNTPEEIWWLLFKDYNLDGLAISRCREMPRDLFLDTGSNRLQMSEKLLEFMIKHKKSIYVYPDTASMDLHKTTTVNTSNTDVYTYKKAKYIPPSQIEIE